MGGGGWRKFDGDDRGGRSKIQKEIPTLKGKIIQNAIMANPWVTKSLIIRGMEKHVVIVKSPFKDIEPTKQRASKGEDYEFFKLVEEFTEGNLRKKRSDKEGYEGGGPKFLDPSP